MNDSGWGVAGGLLGQVAGFLNNWSTSEKLDWIAHACESIMQNQIAQNARFTAIDAAIQALDALIDGIPGEIPLPPGSSEIADAVWGAMSGYPGRDCNYRYMMTQMFAVVYGSGRTGLFRMSGGIDFWVVGLRDNMDYTTIGNFNLNYYAALPHLEGETDSDWLTRVTGYVWADDVYSFNGHPTYYDTPVSGLYGTGLTFVYDPLEKAGLTEDSFMYTPSSGLPKRNALTDALVLLAATSAVLGWTDS